MKQVLFFLTFVIVFSFYSCKNENKNDETKTDNLPVLTVANFNKEAGKYVDKQIVITGIVDHVCRHSGKRIHMVDDGTDEGIHIESETTFNDTLNGSKITLTAIVREFRVDETYCQKLEKDESMEHSEGLTKEQLIEQRKNEALFYRDSMKTTGVDHISFYTLEFVSFK